MADVEMLEFDCDAGAGPSTSAAVGIAGPSTTKSTTAAAAIIAKKKNLPWYLFFPHKLVR